MIYWGHNNLKERYKMRVQNEKVGGAFLKKKTATSGERDIADGYYMKRGASISTDGAILWSYWTPLAKWDGDRVKMDARKYSLTTTLQQSDLRQLCKREGVELVEVMGDI